MIFEILVPPSETRRLAAVMLSMVDDFPKGVPLPIPNQAKPVWITPAEATMGAEISVRLKLPFATVRSIDVRETDGRGNFQSLAAELHKGPNGDTLAVFKALAVGKVNFIMNPDLMDQRFAVKSFDISVAPPRERPLFWPDEIARSLGQTWPISVHIGDRRTLRPVIVFAGAADNPISLRNNATFRAIQDMGAPVIDLRPDGSLTALREGKATIEVGFAWFTTSIGVEVS